jgi:hypothetical protein
MTINVFGGGSSSAPVFPVQRSVRLRSSASAYFNRTLTTPTNNIIWTWSAWVKRGTLGVAQQLMGTGTLGTGADQAGIQFLADNSLTLYQTQTGTGTYEIQVATTQVLRDPSSWYHIVVAYDSAQGTAANRVKIYINGVQVTAFATATYPTSSLASRINAARLHDIGRYGSGVNYFDGYLTEVNFIDGQALTPTSFGSYNSTTGVWQPIKYSGTYGTNGFYLNFQDNSNNTAATIGKDSSGNNNNFTPNGISVTAGVTYDSMLDVPTLTGVDNANFCTGNPLDNATTLTNGNLAVSAGANTGVTGTIAISGSGSFYWETTATTVVAGGNTIVGMIGVSQVSTVRNATASGIRVLARSDGLIIIDATTVQSGLTAWSSGDIIGCAYNATTNSLQFYRNNSAYGTSVTPTAGNTFVPWCCSVVSGTSVFNWNFGQRPFSYTPPTGFKSLNTFNLPDSTIPNGATQFAATTYTGTGSAQTVVNTGNNPLVAPFSNNPNAVALQPDFVWVKGRSGATDHALYDSVRGTTKQLESNDTAAETTEATGLTAFGSSGFTVGALAQMNTNAATYVAWQWKAGGAAVTNTSGSISSQVSANPSAGFSVVTWTVPASGAYTVGHGLGIAPSMIIMKDKTNGTTSWITYHKSISTTTALYLILNSTGGTASSAGIWGSALPTSTVFGNTVAVGTLATDAVVAYCFSEIAGFSKFGSYTGNNSATDGTFVYLGFKPRFLIIKSTSAGTSWVMVDSSRNTYNLSDTSLYSESANSESTIGTVNDIDFLSNGFKLRNNTGFVNASQTYIYAAFAENPFKNALAR